MVKLWSDVTWQKNHRVLVLESSSLLWSLKPRRFISIGSPHNGTLLSQIIPKYPFKGISEMKINSCLLRELSKYNYLLEDIQCISFFTYWDAMVFPGWRANLPYGSKISLDIFKHKNLVRDPRAVERIIEEIIN